MIKRNRRKNKGRSNKKYYSQNSDGPANQNKSIKSVSTNLSSSSKEGEKSPAKKKPPVNTSQKKEKNSRNERNYSDKRNSNQSSSKERKSSYQNSKSNRNKNSRRGGKKEGKSDDKKKKALDLLKSFSSPSQDSHSQRRKKRNLRRINRPTKKDIHQYSVNALEKVSCEICKNPIRNMSTSIIDPTTGNECHFDCVMKKLKAKYELDGKQRIVYIGSGTFAVIEDVKKSSEKIPFKIVKRIEYSKAPVPAEES